MTYVDQIIRTAQTLSAESLLELQNELEGLSLEAKRARVLGVLYAAAWFIEGADDIAEPSAADYGTFAWEEYGYYRQSDLPDEAVENFEEGFAAAVAARDILVDRGATVEDVGGILNGVAAQALKGVVASE